MAAGEGGRGLPLRLEVPPSSQGPREPLHFLPCRLQLPGREAPVRKYFQPAIRKQEGHESSVSFRGRSLKGIDVPVPGGYVGLVLEKDEAPLTETEERRLRVKSAFESLTVWNLEEAPKSTDEILMAFHWPKIAEGILEIPTDVGQRLGVMDAEVQNIWRAKGIEEIGNRSP